MSFFFLPRGYSFCRELFLFAAKLFFLPRAFSFCREVILFAARLFFLPRAFSFCREVILFAASFFFLPRGYSFCRELFLFAARLFFLPRSFFFCRDSCGPHDIRLQGNLAEELIFYYLLARKGSKLFCLQEELMGYIILNIHYNIHAIFLSTKNKCHVTK